MWVAPCCRQGHQSSRPRGHRSRHRRPPLHTGLADLVSRAYIQCMAEMAEGPRRNAERRRALELLAASSDGCTAAILLAHGFKSDRLVELINAGLASVTTERVVADDRAMQVTR